MSTKIEPKKTYEELYAPSGEFRMGIASAPARSTRTNFGKRRKLQLVDNVAKWTTYTVLFVGILALSIGIWRWADKESFDDFVDEGNGLVADFRNTVVDRN